MLVQIVALVVGVVFFILVSLLRNALSLTFFKYTLDLLPKNFQSSSSWNELYVETKNELERIGFIHVGWLSIKSNSHEHAGISSVISVFSNKAQSSQVLVMPPLYIDRPNTLAINYISWLENDTVLSSKAFDVFNELVADGKKVFAQTLTISGIEQQWQLHLNWRNQFALKSDNNACQIQHLLKSCNHLFADTDRLLEAKKVWQDKRGIIRPTFRFALKMIKVIRHYNKQIKPDYTLAPIDRLIDISSFTIQVQQSFSLSVFWQWGLFVISCLLFVALGYVFFGLMVALLIFIAIVIHEAGHFLTMRAFGYKNTQIIALPLLGGVTTGIKQEQTTAQRAWVSMMGPLPGIVLGWALVFICVPYAAELNSLHLENWLFYGILTLLIINYLNLLPIIPLDGGNIIHCLLPPRWFNVRITLIILSSLLAVYIAWYFNVYIIAIVGLFELFFTLPMVLSQRNIINKLIKNADFATSNKQQKLHYIIQVLIENATPQKGLMARAIMQQAYSLLEIFTQQSIKKTQQLILGSIYIGLFVIPLLIVGYSSNLIDYIHQLKPMTYIDYTISPEAQARLEQIKKRREIANKLSFDELLQTKFNNELVTPATEQEIIATENRLAHPLPSELKKLYHHSNGIPQLGILPIEQVILSSQWAGWNNLFETNQESLTIMSIDDIHSSEELTRSSLNWIYIGELPENEYLFYRLDLPQENQGTLISCYYQECMEYESLYVKLKEKWIYQQTLLDE